MEETSRTAAGRHTLRQHQEPNSEALEGQQQLLYPGRTFFSSKANSVVSIQQRLDESATIDQNTSVVWDGAYPMTKFLESHVGNLQGNHV
ncbi:hypothetical protein BKA57DRAFT_539159 [Linnemannia elongata]|nr:hypothetical protein BKA57DRAFT_539159 [Linnemannia elongata]